MDQMNREPDNGQRNNEPQQGMPQQGMPGQGMPQQGMPGQGMPQQGMPQQGIPGQGMDPNTMWQYHNQQFYGYQGKPHFGLLEMDDMQQALMNSDVMHKEGISPKKLLSKAGIALAIFAAVVLGVQSIIEALVGYYQPNLIDTDWYVWAVTAISLVIIGFPIYYLLMKRVPDSPKGPVVKLKLSSFIKIFFICVASMYITNFFSTILTYLIAIIKGEELVNPAAQAILNGNFFITLVYAAVVAPIIEEMIFRKILLDKVRRFGDIPAILITGIAFGLFHLNLSQFFYATVLGFIFAYVTIRTNTIVYSIILHMMINFLSTMITPLVTNLNIFAILGIVAWEFVAIAAGIVFFVLSFRKIKLYRSAPVMKLSSYFLNAGTILYLLICFVVIVLLTVL